MLIGQVKQRVTRVVSGVGCIGLVLFLGACAQHDLELPPTPPEEQQSDRIEEYRIGSEDVIEVTVWKNEDLSRVVNVRPDGRISLPLIGDLQVAGLTPEELNESIATALQQYYKEPAQVSVILQQVNSYAIYVMGAVQGPGRYVVKSGTTFLQALTLAGGFKDFASANKLIVRRRNGYAVSV